MDKVLTARNTRYIYESSAGRVEALKGLDLTVRRGEIFGFIGPNGAGKTTTIKLLLGILSPFSGEVEIFGKSPERPAVRGAVGYMPETADYYRYLTPAELLRMYGNIFGIEKSVLVDRTNKLLAMVGLESVRNRLIRTFSKGMVQKVSFAQALVNDPDLLILDEPTSGLDPIARRNMRDVIQRLRTEGKTVFFSSHELSEVELICDRIGIMNKGSLVAEGSASDLLGAREEGQTLENYFLNMIGEDR